MAVRVAINGFGRIGRLAFRQMFDAEGYEVVAINDLTSPKMLAHLLKYDSSQGVYKYASTVEAGEDSITVNGKTITIYKEADASKLPWGELKVDVFWSVPDSTPLRRRLPHISLPVLVKLLFLLPQVTTFLPSYTMLTTRP